MYSHGFWSLPPASDHLFAPPKTPSRSRTIAEDEEAHSKTSGCSHLKPSACTWICRLSNGDQRGLVNLNTSSTANSTQTAEGKLGSYSVRVRAPKRRQYEFIPGSFVYTEVISESEEEEEEGALLFAKTRGRGTRDKPFYLDLDHTKDPDRSLSLLPRADEQSGLEIGATWSEPKHNDEIGSCDPKSSGDGNPPTTPAGADDGDKKQSALPEKTYLEAWPCEKRKQYLFSNPSRTVQQTIKRYVTSMHSTLDPQRTPQSCWLCPEHGRAATSISRFFTWRGHGHLHRVNINYGIISLMHHNRLTEVQKHGFISLGWHLSHLCGNWTCVNPAHCTVEPGSVNIGRNKCFRDKEGPCEHVPSCLKELKRGVVPGEGAGSGLGLAAVMVLVGGVEEEEEEEGGEEEDEEEEKEEGEEGR
ncbi:MAG: hypothetical protein M1840_004053 [Geoglossum simile]|nr:MAG: hypothetical protein M1840_004053 [Geoglossum simile]